MTDEGAVRSTTITKSDGTTATYEKTIDPKQEANP